jgi:hypothetical protein
MQLGLYNIIYNFFLCCVLDLSLTIKFPFIICFDTNTILNLLLSENKDALVKVVKSEVLINIQPQPKHQQALAAGSLSCSVSS